MDGGLMDKFPVLHRGRELLGAGHGSSGPGHGITTRKRHTVTALWNYAQRVSPMSDNDFDTRIRRPSHARRPQPGVRSDAPGATPAVLAGVTDNGTDLRRRRPRRTTSARQGATIAMSGYQHRQRAHRETRHLGVVPGGFASNRSSTGPSVCGASHTTSVVPSSPTTARTHDPFQYYASTSNPCAPSAGERG